MKISNVLVLFALLATATVSHATGSKDIKLTAECYLTRVTWDDKANEKVLEPFAPDTAKNVPIKIQNVEDGNIKMKRVEFTAQTPEGAMTLTAHISALGGFGNSAMISAPMTIELKDKDMSVSDPQSFAPDLDYSDANIFLNPMPIARARYSFGLKGDGTVKVVYEAGCDLKVTKN